MNDSGLDQRSLDPEGALKDGSTELYDQVRHRILEPGGSYFFGKAILLYPDLTRRAHLPLCLFLEQTLPLSKLVEYPRRHLKTTLVTVTWTLCRFARAVIRGEDPIERIAIVSSTKPNAMRFLRQIKYHPERNQIFQAFIPELIPDFNEDTWNQEEITFPRYRARDAPSIDTFGSGTKATSRHFDGIIEDDMINEENWDSPTAIEKAIQLHQLAENLLEDADNSWRITNENAWTQFDLNHHIIDTEKDTGVFSVGASTGLNAHRSRLLDPTVLQLTEEWNDGDTLWPERFSREALVRIRAKVGAFIYNAQYENNPFDPDIVDFKVEWLGRFEWTKAKHEGSKREELALRLLPKVVKDGVGNVLTETPMELVFFRDLNVVGAWDLATGAKTTPDRNAYVVVGVDSKERVFLLEVKAKKTDPLKFVWKVFGAIARWSLFPFGVETVAFQKILMTLLPNLIEQWNQKCLEKKKPLRQLSYGVFEEVKPLYGKNKEGRIRFLISIPCEQGRVYVHETQTDFLDEYTHFPKGKTDDVLDAFAYTAYFWRPGTTWEEDQEEANLETERDLTRDPVTGY